MGLAEAYVPLCVSLLDPLVDAMNQRVEKIHQQAVELVGGLQVIPYGLVQPTVSSVWTKSEFELSVRL